MRTCPACGKDTDAGAVEPCTECGFSPIDPQTYGEQPSTPTEPDEATFEVGEDSEPGRWGRGEAPDEPPVATEPAPQEGPGEPEQQQPRRIGGIVWLIVAAVAIIVNATGIFDREPGPQQSEVEAAIAVDARELGFEAKVRCESGAEDTEVGGTFDCVATAPSGRRATVTVTNNEDSYEWNTAPLVRLARDR